MNQRKGLSPLHVWALAFGCVVGSGAFVMPGSTFLPDGGPVGTTIAMLVGAAIMLLIAVSYHAMMNCLPGPGGAYAYTKAAFGSDHAFLCAWFLSLAYISIIPLNATAFSIIGRCLFANLFQTGPHYSVAGYAVYPLEILLAEGSLLVFCLMVVFGRRAVKYFQTGLALVLAGGVAVISVFAVLRTQVSAPVPAFGLRLTPVTGVVTLVLLTPFAFVGFDSISMSTPFFGFPLKKSFSILASAILCGAFMYIALTWVATAALPAGQNTWQAYVSVLDHMEGIATLPTFFAAWTLMGRGGLILITAAAIAAILTGIMGFTLAASRLFATMAQDGILPRVFSNNRFAVFFIIAASMLGPFFGRTVLNWIVDVSTLGAVTGFAYTAAATFHLSRDSRPLRYAGALGAGIAIFLDLVLMIPGLLPVQTLASPSYLILALWSLIGFFFYWRKIRHNPDASSALAAGGVLFALVFFSSTMWFVLKLLQLDLSRQFSTALIWTSVIQLLLILMGMLAVFFLYAQLRQRQRLLEKQKIQAEESSRAKTTFLFNMSHDIRTPMNAIIGYTTLARKEPDTPGRVEEYLEKIENSSQQLLALINDILEMSRIESGKMELEPVRTNLNAAMAEVRDLFATQMREKGVRYVVETRDLTEPWVLCDKNRMDRIMLNLISNAYKFTPAGGTVSVILAQDRPGVFTLRVKDTGIGMSEEFATRVFEAFERERTSTVSGIQGTGLGMAITKSLVDMMGGSIAVHTAPGKGTELEIHLSFPVTEGESEEVSAADAVQMGEFSSIHLLLVEDNEVNREIATLILGEAGFQLDTAENGKIAVEKMRENPAGTYDLILMDVQMPVMGGYEATGLIRAMEDKEKAGIPILAMTANAFAEDIQAAREAGMDGHIAKPLDVGKMIATLTETLQKKR